MSNRLQQRTQQATALAAAYLATFTVEEKNTVGFMVPGMPMVAATPYLVALPR
jgi:predicted thioesterase